MYIADVIKKERKKRVPLKRICEIKRYYLSLYRCYMISLYDKDYISDPTIFDKKEILKLLMEMGIEDSLTTYMGKIDLSSGHIKYALYRNKDADDDVKEFLSLLYKAVMFRELSITIDNIFETFVGNASKLSVRVNMNIKGNMITQGFDNIPFNEAFARCVSKFEEKTKSISIKNEIWYLFLKELGIPKEDALCDGLFDSKLTHKEEVECMEGIFEGIFKVDNGKYTDLLISWLSSHKWDYTNINSRTERKGLYEYVLCTNNKVTDCINKVLTKYEKKIEEGQKIDILAIEKDRIYYNVPRTTLDVPFGVFSIICDEGGKEKISIEGNIVYGYTGELYTYERLISDDITYVGCPIVLKDGIRDVYYYDIEQTDILSKSWFKVQEDADIVFSDIYLPDNPFKQGSLEYDLFEGYKNSLKSADNLITKVNVSNYNYKSFIKIVDKLYNVVGV